MKLVWRWATFVRERFEPISHGLMIGVFFTAHLAYMGWPAIASGELVLLFAGVVAFFFKLRLYDEIKDYETDLKVNPTRPLARGLVQHRDLYQGIVACILIENAAFLHFGWQAWVTYLVALAYSGLMFKEFFIGDHLRPHLTTYAVSHTFVSVMLSLSIFAAVGRQGGWELNPNLWLAALSSWCVFNIFEFARKTFAPAEERPNVDSYSKVFGPTGAGILVIVMAVVGLALASRVIHNAELVWIQGVLILMLSASAAFHSLYRTALGAKTYRSVGSLYIVLFYFSIIVASGVF